MRIVDVQIPWEVNFSENENSIYNIIDNVNNELKHLSNCFGKINRDFVSSGERVRSIDLIIYNTIFKKHKYTLYNVEFIWNNIQNRVIVSYTF